MEQSHKIRIALVSTSFPLDSGSTSGIFIQNLASHLAKYTELTVITPDNTEEKHQPLDDSYALLCFRYAPRKWQKLAHLPGGIPTAINSNKWLILLLPFFIFSMIFKCIRISKNIDLIHANWSVNGVIAGIAGLITHTPVITTLRGTDITKTSNKRLYKLLLKTAARLNSHIVTVNSSMKNHVASIIPSKKEQIMVIPNGVDDNFIHINREYTVKPDIQLITVGNLIPEKGIDIIIEAIASLRNELNIVLTIIGTGAEKSRLEELAKSHNILSQVLFKGNIEHHLVPEFLSQADIYVSGSYGEGRPNSIIEAMASGLPVIGTDISGISEIVQHDISGLLYPPGDSNTLAEHLLLCHKPLTRKKYGEAARQYVLTHGLTWDNCARSYVNLYNEIHDKKHNNR